MSEGLDPKKLLYKTTSEVSRGSAKLGNAIGWDYLEQEGKKNTGNPGRAVGKAAASVAAWYLGGLAGAGAGAGGAAAGEAAAGEVAKTAAEKAAEEALKQEVLNSAQYAGGGLLSTAPGPGVVAPGMQGSAWADTQLINAGHPEYAGGRLTGLLGNRGTRMAQKYAINQGAKSLMSQPQQAPQQHSQPYQQPAPSQPIYGASDASGGLYGGGLMNLSEEEKRKLLMLMQQRGY